MPRPHGTRIRGVAALPGLARYAKRPGRGEPHPGRRWHPRPLGRDRGHHLGEPPLHRVGKLCPQINSDLVAAAEGQPTSSPA
jgi:hypothetical protein